MKRNCWEIINCGKEFGGLNSLNKGVCPASTHVNADGINGGKCGGRICWAVPGTFCYGEVQGDYAEKQLYCKDCEVFNVVKQEEINEFRMFLPDQFSIRPEE